MAVIGSRSAALVSGLVRILFKFSRSSSHLVREDEPAKLLLSTTVQIPESLRAWVSLAPAFALMAYFVIGFIWYGLRTLSQGAYDDPDISRRGSGRFLGMYVRMYFAWIIQPPWRLILWSGISANTVTALSGVVALGSGIAAGTGSFAVAGWMFIGSGILDVMDGRLARVYNQSSARGQALDSILDRYADGAILVGLAWYYRSTWVVLPALLALLGTQLVPYIKARGESLGLTVKVGVMQRAERIVYLGAALALSPVVAGLTGDIAAKPDYIMATIGICLTAVTTHFTALQRFSFVLSELSATER